MSLQELAEEFEGEFTLTQIESLWRSLPEPKDPKNKITKEEFRFFLDRCVSSGLDPFEKQIGIIKRKGRISIDANIGGLRAIAERSGFYAGTTPSFWCGEEGIWKEIWLKKWGYPAASKIGVYKRGCSEPFWGTANWDEFVQEYNGKPGDMWAKMPAHMLGKVAEAIALRRAFPSGAKTEAVQIDTSADNAIVSSYHHMALPPASVRVVALPTWEQRLMNLSLITSCPMPTIRALCFRWLNCGINNLTEESGKKLRSLVLIQWASTVHLLSETDATSLFKQFWKPDYSRQDDDSIFRNWRAFVESRKAQIIEVQSTID